MGAQSESEPPDFRIATRSLHDVQLRPEIELSDTPAPQRLAPYSLALTADVVVDGEDVGSGRFVVLHDPAGHEAWDGVFRIVTFVRAPVEPDLAGDNLLPNVGWTWLTEALEAAEAPYRAASGTVTRVLSESFGAMSGQEPTADLEIRASWTATDPKLGAHLSAWADLLAQVAGIPPVPAGVTTLPSTSSHSRRKR